MLISNNLIIASRDVNKKPGAGRDGHFRVSVGIRGTDRVTLVTLEHSMAAAN